MKQTRWLLCWGLPALVVMAAAWIPAFADETPPPQITIMSPKQGEAVHGDRFPLLVQFAAAGNYKATRVELLVDGVQVGEREVKPPENQGSLIVFLDTTRLVDGEHTVQVKVYDESGQQGAYRIRVYVNNQPGRRQPPRVTISHPLDHQPVSGRVEVRVAIEDDVTIQWVIFYVDDTFKALRNYPPYIDVWDTTRLENGPHKLRVKVVNALDLVTEKEITVLVDNPGGRTMRRTSMALPGEGAQSTGPAAASQPVVSATQTVTTLPTPGVTAPPTPWVAAPPTPRSTPSLPPQVASPREAAPALAAGPGPAAVGIEPPPLMEVQPRGEQGTGPSPMPPRLSLPGEEKASAPAAASDPSSEEAVQISLALDQPRQGAPTIAAPVSPITGLAASLEAAPAPIANTTVSLPISERVTAPVPSVSPLRPLPSLSRNPLPPGKTAPDLSLPGDRPGASEVAISTQPRTLIHGRRPQGWASAASSGQMVPSLRERISLPREGHPPVPPVVQTAPQPSAAPAAVRSLALSRTHVIQRGETLSLIAQRYGVEVGELARLNNLRNPNQILAGQRLVVPGSTAHLYFDRQPVQTDVSPFMQHGIALAPFRHIFEQTGGAVEWEHLTKKVLASSQERTVELVIGNRRALVNRAELLMELAPFIREGRTIVPLSFISEAMDVTVQIDPESGNIYITSND